MTRPPRLCVVHQNDGTDVRLGKLCRSLSRLYDVTLLGWDREGVELAPDLGSATANIYRRQGRYGRGGLMARLAFLFWVVRSILRQRPTTVVAVNEEIAAAILPLKLFRRFKLVIDIHDPLADRVSLTGLRGILQLVQTAARFGADSLLVTDTQRFARIEDRWKSKTSIIPNYPDRPLFPMPAQVAPTDDVVRIAAVGSLHSNRGMQVLRAAAERAAPCQLELAGWFTDEASASLAELPYCRYHGVIGMQESLQLMAGCDVVFCFYNPKVVNNIHASPNKIYEAICLGKRSIINSETLVAEWVTTNGFGYACAFDDVEALAQILNSVRAGLAAHRGHDPRLLAFAEGRLYWSVAEPALLAVVE